MHTSAQTIGQIYVPLVNWALMVVVIVLVLTFQSSAALAYAFGMAVTGTIMVTTLLLAYVVRRQWGWSRWVVVPGAALALGIEALFFAANLTKLLSGAWLPLTIALVIFTVMTTWQRGRRVVSARREQLEGSLREFVDELHERRPPLLRVPGTAVYLNRGKSTAPLAMRAGVEHHQVLQERVVIASLETAPVPVVADEEIAEIDDLGYADDGITLVTLRFGYMQRTDVCRVLADLPTKGLEAPVVLDGASYFLSTIDLEPGEHPSMPRWQTALFLATSSLTADAARAFELPRDRTVVIGSRISV